MVESNGPYSLLRWNPIRAQAHHVALRFAIDVHGRHRNRVDDGMHGERSWSGGEFNVHFVRARDTAARARRAQRRGDVEAAQCAAAVTREVEHRFGGARRSAERAAVPLLRGADARSRAEVSSAGAPRLSGACFVDERFRFAIDAAVHTFPERLRLAR